MANNQRYTLTFDAQLNVSQMKGALSGIQGELNKLKLPSNMAQNLQSTFNKLEKEIQNFENLTSKNAFTGTEFNKISASASKISDAYSNLITQVKSLGNLSDSEIRKLFPDDVVNKIKAGENALKSYQTTIDGLNKKLSESHKALQEWQDKLVARTQRRDSYQSDLDNLKANSKTVTEMAKAAGIKQEIADYKALEEAIKTATKAKADYTKAVNNGDRKANALTEKGLDKQIERLNQVKDAYDQQGKAISDAQAKVSRAQGEMTKANNKITELQVSLTRVQTEVGAGAGDALKQLFDDLNTAGFDTTNVQQNINGATDAVNNFTNTLLGQARQGLAGATSALTQYGTAINNNTNDVNANEDANRRLDDRLDDISSLKKRIQYFFGLNNAINLTKRAIRDAFNTIKELDKVMTETAVVTDFTVSDMWKQLPEYTKRANELGVTTKAAYESATLYYQQGLNTQQAAELSTETLKMARIAGLEAAEATDRMTNALRGFNMELNALNAQRVDDVYSQLAAMSASNVDEISTAMTKVASLAHSANMEFETTSAFLAQIIETTRESAETAGTALKTVVARFSEVKTLYSESQISGTDEEGQAINVNKVAAALRTAGIDLNKYFLGEVGLDDIFIELASKWDSLTSIQQRYIATQAAGSRQQSRFIALMQDYARTQELVTAAYDANGASAKQFAKTQESLESKLARLKNAWNEFLMGLANSVVIKTAVDLLTNLLNVVNNLTSVFGSSLGTVLKWGAAVATIAGGKALTSTGFANFLASIGIGSGISKKGSKLFGGIGKLGENALFGTQLLGDSILAKIGVDTGAVSNATLGITGLATALMAVAAAAGVAATAYALWLKNTKAGQYKQAQAYAEAMAKAASETQKTAKNLQSAKEQYETLIDKVQGATTRQDRENAIQSRNDYISSLLQEDPTFYQYIKSIKDEKGHFILTLDEAKLASACDKIAESAVRTAAEASLAQGGAYMAQAAMYYKKAADWNQVAASTSNEKWRQEELSNAAIAQNQAEAAMLRGRNTLAQGAREMLSLDKNVTNEMAETIAIAFADNFDSDAYQKALSDNLINGIARGENYWRGQYFNVFGEEAGTGMSATEMRRAVASKQAMDEQYGDIDKYTKLASDENGKLLMDIVAGTAEKLYDTKEISNIYSKLDEGTQALFNELYKIEEGTFEKRAETYANRLKKAQNDITKTTVLALKKAGIKDTGQLQKIVDNLSISQKQQLSDFAAAWESYGPEFNETLLNIASDMMLNSQELSGSELGKLINNITENPISSLQALIEATNNADKAVQDFLKGITGVSNPTLGNFQQLQGFATEDLVQYYLLSSEFEGLNDQIEKFIEANGELNSANINELAKSSKSLNTLLGNNIVSASGLAKAITAFQSGNVTISDLNSRVLTVLGSFDSLGDSISRAGTLIKEFDAGEDYGDAVDFINSQLKDLQELVDARRVGSPQAKNIWSLFFGEENIPKTIKDWEDGIKTVQDMMTNGGAGFWTKAMGFSMDQEGNIADMGVKEFADGAYESYKEYLKSKTSEYNFSDDFYDLMIRNMAAHDTGVVEEIAAVETQKILDAYGKEMPTKGDIQALADAYGLKPQDILDAWAEKFGQEKIDFSKLEDTLKASIPSLADVFKQKFADDGTTDIGTMLQKLGTDESGIFSLDELKLKVGEIVPEIANGSISIEEWINKQLDGKPVKVPITLETDTKDENGNWAKTTQEVTLEITDAKDLTDLVDTVQNNLDATFFANSLLEGSASAQQISEYLTNLGNNTKLENVQTTLTASATKANEINAALSAEINKTVNITTDATEIKIVVTGAAKGGIVSAAGGTIKPGLALTGEEAPEIVWNKNKGYAYLAGKNGPEINNLQPGDQVFNGQQTKEILKRSGLRSFAKGTIGSYAGTTWNNGSGSGGSGSGADKAKEDKWKNEIDWLYNLVEDIAELERIQTQLEEKYEDYLDDESKTGQDLYELLVQQLGNLQTQLNHQTLALEKREQEMREFMDTTNKYDDYLWYNWEDRTIEIDWDKIEALQDTDKETYEEIKDLISQAEDIQGKMDDAEDAIQDIQNQIQELENIWRDTYSSFEKRIYQAIVQQYQKVIDEFSDLNTALNDSNSAILESLQRQVDLERQQRSNEKTQQGISDREAQLAYLRRDTTGGNALAALELEKQLAEDRESYEDTLVDQAIARLQQDNSEAADQRARQIEIMQAQLDYQSESGEFNAEVLRLITDATSGEGALLTGSDLVKLLQSADNWSGMSEVNREIWEEELNNTFKQAVAFLLKDQAENTVIAIDENGNEITQFIDDVNKYVQAIAAKIGAISQAKGKNSSNSSSNSGGGGGGSGGSAGGSSTKVTRYYQIVAGGKAVDSTEYTTREAANQTLSVMVNNAKKNWEQAKAELAKDSTNSMLMNKFQKALQLYQLYQSASVVGKNKTYKTGGLVNSTGLAWLDGTKSRPEYVLNARQTDAFLHLVDVLPSIMGKISNTSIQSPTNIELNIEMKVDKISSDYDVDKIADRVKNIIYNVGSYRNVNTLSLKR